jgi:hypothetical protein
MKILALAGLVALCALAGDASAQTHKGPTSPATAQLQKSSESMADKHTLDGEVTKVDAKKGWVDVKTPDGRMKLHFPPSALEGVKVGDSLTIELGMRKTASVK